MTRHDYSRTDLADIQARARELRSERDGLVEATTPRLLANRGALDDPEVKSKVERIHEINSKLSSSPFTHASMWVEQEHERRYRRLFWASLAAGLAGGIAAALSLYFFGSSFSPASAAAAWPGSFGELISSFPILVAVGFAVLVVQIGFWSVIAAFYAKEDRALGNTAREIVNHLLTFIIGLVGGWLSRGV